LQTVIALEGDVIACQHYHSGQKKIIEERKGGEIIEG
jgi:hypothetical protein